MGIVLLLLLVAAIADLFIPWLRVPGWEGDLALAGAAVYTVLVVWRNPRNNGLNHWPRWRS